MSENEPSWQCTWDSLAGYRILGFKRLFPQNFGDMVAFSMVAVFLMSVKLSFVIVLQCIVFLNPPRACGFLLILVLNVTFCFLGVGVTLHSVVRA